METFEIANLGWSVWGVVAPHVGWGLVGLLALGIPLISWAREVVRDWQEHRKIQMILQARPGSLVMSQSERGRTRSTLVVLVGDGDLTPARQVTVATVERWQV